MRKILLSAITLMMSVAMMAIGLGDGTSKANAIDFDWANGNVHESSEALWYDVDMTPVDDAKYLVLYLTNLADEAATVHIDMSVQGYDANMSGIDTIIAAGDYYRFEFPKEMINTLLETYGLSAYADQIKNLSLSLQSDQKVMLAANVYTTEAEFIQQEVLTHLEEIDWNKGVKQDALSTKWYEVDITSVKNNQQHLQVSFKNYANETAVLAVSFILNNEIHTLPIPVPAGFERSQVIDYQILRLVPSKTIKVGVTTTATIEVATSVKSALAEDQTPCLTAIDPQHGVEYTQAAGTTQWYKLSLDWLESQADYSSLYLANKGSQTAHVTIGMVPDCKYTTGTKVTLPIPAGFDLGLVAPNIVGRLLNELSRLERLYGKVDSKDVYLEIHADQELGFGLDVVNATTNPCLREDLIAFDWNKGATLTPNVAQWYDIDITKVKDSGKHIKLTFTNPTNTIVWVASVVSIDCPAKLTMPMIMPIYPGMSVDKVIDYSFMAAQPIDNIYVGVVAEEAIIMGAATIDAVVEEPIDCINHVEVKTGERYVHNAGTTWYKFSNELLEDMGKAPRFTFENLSSNAITFTAGVTVDCKYGILTHAKAKIPAHILGQHLHNREFAVRIPRIFFQAARKLIDPDVTEFMLQLTANNPFAFSIDMKADDACDDAQVFDWKGCFDLKANQSAWYKVDVNTPLNSKEPITVALYNNSDYPVIVSAEVSPTCPSLISMVEKYEIGALDSVIVSVKPEKVAEMIKEYSDYLSNLSCYARFHATGDVTVCVNDERIINPDDPTIDEDECKDVPELDWKKEIVLSDLVMNQMYKLNIKGLYDAESDIELWVNNDVHTDSVIISSEVYTHCDETSPVAKHQNKVAADENWPLIAYDKFAALVTPEQNYMYVIFTAIDTIPVAPDTPVCEDVKTEFSAKFCENPYIWNGVEYAVAGDYIQSFPLASGCDSIVTLHLTKECPQDPECVTVYGEFDATFCEQYNWNGVIYTKAGDYDQTFVAVTGCDSIVTMHLTEDCEITDECEDVETEFTAYFCESFTWNKEVYTKAGDYKQVLSKTDGCDSIVTLHLIEDCEPIEPGEDCEHATLLNWRNGIRLSQLSAGWYKLYVGDVHANQESVTAKVINDLDCKATVTAAAYSHCESDEAIADGSKLFKLGESTKTVSYADFAATVPAYYGDYVYVNIASIVENCEPIEPGEDCENAIALDWSDVKLSQLKEGNWYKLDFSEVHATQSSATFKATNDLNGDATVSAAAYYHCEDVDAMGEATKKLVQGHVGEREVSYKELTDVIGHASILYVQVTDITVAGEDCENAIALDWSDVKLSQLVEGNWYKLDFSEVHATQSSATFKATNDLNGDATVSAAAYYHCEDVDAMGEATKKLVQGHVGEREVSYKELTDVIGHASVLYVQVTDITVAGEDCENAIALDWSDVKLSQLVEGNWYKLDFSEVHANQSSATFKATNDLNGDATVSAAAYYHCEDVDAMGEATKKLVQGHVGEREVSYKELTDVIGHAPVLYVQVTDITVTPEPVEKDTVVNNVTEFVCDGTEYVDLQGEKHIVSSLIDPALLTWTTTIETETTVTIYNYVITPIVAPVVMTADVLATIPGATPVLVAGEKVDVTGTVEAIKNYYDMNDTEAIADVETVVWTAGADATLTCDAESHTMILTVTSGCEFVWSAELTFDVTPAEDKEFNVTACDSYEWHGVTYTESGDYTFEAECYKEILHLTINETEVVELTETACESYEWHGETYTESGDYTFEDECYKEILHLTINTVVTEDVTASDCYAYEWNGVTYTKSGNYTFNTTSVVTGCDSIVTLHLTITAETPEENPALGNAEAVVKYGNRMIVLHLNGFAEKYGWTPANGQVTWYQVVGEMDNSWEIVDDKVLGSGMYIEDLNGFTGQIYAIIDSSNEGACGNLYRTKVLVLAPAGQAPKLMPTIARPSEDLHLLNLNSANVAEVRVYNTSGELMSVYKAEEASEFVFKAETLPGYYLVEVQHNGEQTTLRYIVK